MATATVPAPTQDEQLLARVNAVVDTKAWSAYTKGFERSIISRVHADQSLAGVVTDALENALKRVEDWLFFRCHRHQEKLRLDLVGRKWFCHFARNNPEDAEFLTAPLPQTCSQEDLVRQNELMQAARQWAQESYERRETQRKQRITKIRTRCLAATKKRFEFGEYQHINAESHKLIADGPADDANPRQLDNLTDALNAFFSWANGSDCSTARMGLSTSPAGQTSHRSKGAKHRRRQPANA